MPKNVDYGARVDVVGSGVSEGEMRVNKWEDGKLDYQERVTVIWTEKVKSMGPGALDGVKGGRGCVEERVIFVDMANVGVLKRVDKTASNPPVIVVSSDIRTLGNRDRNRGRMVGVFRHTLGRRDSCQW